MRVVLVTQRYWPALGGIESFARQLARGLASAHDVTVIAETIGEHAPGRLGTSLARPPGFTAFEDGAVQVVPVRRGVGDFVRRLPLAYASVPGIRRYAYGRPRTLALAWSAAALGGALRPAIAGADVVHALTSDVLGAMALGAARAALRPVAVTPFAHRGEWADGPGDAALYRRADAVIALLADEAALYRELGVRAERIHVSGAFAAGVARGGAAQLRARYGIEGPVVLFLGARRPYKGVDLLAGAAPAIRGRHPTARVAFVGPGPAIQSRDPAILDVGPVAEQDRAAWLDAADVLCLPSGSETFGLVVLEAWSTATPVVVSRIPALAELVCGAGGGVVVERTSAAVADGVCALLGDPERAGRLGRAGESAWRAKYTPAAAVAWHEALYRELSSTRPQRIDGRRVKPGTAHADRQP